MSVCETMKSKVVASLVLGIVACVLVWFGYSAAGGLVCGIIGLVFAVQIKKACEEAGEELNSMAKAGMVLNIIGVVLCAVMFVVAISCIGCVACAGCASALS